MSYLRGATMKVGQTLANFPDIVPREFVETLEQLHFDAPPMHWSLLREMVHNELGDDPENLFRLLREAGLRRRVAGPGPSGPAQDGEEVAVKIQYPGIARTIREDFRNLFAVHAPRPAQPRLGEHQGAVRRPARRGWSAKPTTSRKRPRCEKVATLFREDDGIVVPRVYPRAFDRPAC